MTSHEAPTSQGISWRTWWSPCVLTRAIGAELPVGRYFLAKLTYGRADPPRSVMRTSRSSERTVPL
jgi:hypothetical protein